ncbi:PREDICTED: uncharacterized protein LOC101299466 isoform X1 [Fragaria vesca subsp. vesca]|uniref:uncharacterized protein LOC101299466 isoform X1 n=1 Tax=Fragaria vesca subsp. vesca TaxID=101020 RepID=UPI0002C32BD7|nr:PREDICTED: uncharacterized protein LOC101299466 isoform X1 [Fragaria vesca subsp. vesca]
MKSNSSLSLSGSSLAAVESLSMPLFQEVVLSSDIRCSGCQSRLADMMSKMGADIESVVVSASEKKVTIICRYPSTAAAKVPDRLVPAVHRSPLKKFALIKRILRSS